MTTKKTQASGKRVPAARQKAPARVKEKPVILITNDDGITAPGIRNLVEAVRDIGKIVVVAPDKPQSGMGHAITIGQPLRLHKVPMFEGAVSYTHLDVYKRQHLSVISTHIPRITGNGKTTDCS